MEVAGKIYKGGNTSITTIAAYTNCTSNDRKLKGGESASTTNPETGRAGKRKTRNAGHTSDRLTGGKNACCMAPVTLQKSVKYEEL